MIALWLLACAQDPCAGTEDMTTSPAGLELTAEEHDIGWGETECFLCHQAWTIHAQDCVDGVRIDVAAIDAPEAAGLRAPTLDDGEGLEVLQGAGRATPPPTIPHPPDQSAQSCHGECDSRIKGNK